jgi:tetratricopeptide (TPR) repeat protein/class 3 adenylate cyclase
MRNLVPERVVKNLIEKKHEDTYLCFSMFVDVSGFTKTTEALMKHGQEGAEVLSDILKYLFDTTVSAVYERGGYVTKYAGDAFTAIFEIGEDPKKTAVNVLDSAIITNRFFEENKIYKSKYGNFEFGVKVGLAYGECNCGIVGSVNEKTYYFSGSAVDLCAMAEHNASKGDIWMSETIYPFLAEYLSETEESELYGMKFYKAVRTKEIIPKIKKYKAAQFDKESIYRLTGKIEAEFPVGEFRDIISVFISFEGDGILDKLMERLYELKDIYGASHPVLDFGDKGGNILLFFGAPISYENNSYRALTFISKLFETFNKDFKLRAGLAKGVVYCGFNGSDLRNEFTCLGNTVNQSARFMMKAEWGQILTDKELSLNENFISDHLGDIQYKGREGLIPTYILKGKAEIKDVFFKGSFIGREKEKTRLRKYLSPLEKGRYCGVIYIDGESGIGKSRLTNQIRHNLTIEAEKSGKKLNWFYFSCEEIIREPYNPFKYFFHRFFDFEENSVENNTEKYDAKLLKIRSYTKDTVLKDDLVKYKDYLSYFLGLKVSNPEIIAEEPNERQNSVVLSLISFFRTFCEYSPLVFEVDNASFIDGDSIKLLSRISIALRKDPFAIIFNCRFKDNGGTYNFELGRQKRICIKSLKKAEFKELAKDRLKLKTIPTVTLSVLDEKSHRNPLYLEQMVIYIRDNSVLDHRNRIKDVSSIPNGINQIILARIDKLQSNLKDIIKAASCLGNEVQTDLISFLFRNKYDSIAKYLVELENEDILIIFSEISYLFKFGVIRDVVYDIQLKKTVRELHEQIGEAIENIHKDILEKYFPVLAYHFEQAENFDKALEYHNKAGFQAKMNYQNSQALYHFDKADYFISQKNSLSTEKWIDAVSRIDNAEVKNYVEINFERFHFNFTFVQNIQKCSEIMENIYRITEKLGDSGLLSRSMIEQSLILTHQGKYDESIKMLENAVTILKKLELDYKISLCQLNIGKNYFMSGRFDQAIAFFDQALENSANIQDHYERDKIRAKIFGDIGIASDYAGNFDKALDYYNRQLKLSEELNLKIDKAGAVGNIGIIYHMTGNLQKAKDYYEMKLKLSEELGLRLDLAQILNNMGFLYKDLKNYKKAISYHKKSFSLSSELNDNSTMAGASVNLGHVYKILGDFNKSEQYYLKGIKIAEQYGFKHIYAEAMIEIADMYFINGEKNSSLKFADLGLKAAKEIGFSEYIEKGTEIFEKINSK